MAHFYLTLPSNSSMSFYDNTLTNFITRLHTPVALQGDWEVGLNEIMFPKNWYNVRRMGTPHIKMSAMNVEVCGPPNDSTTNLYSTELELHTGHYDSAEKLIGVINGLITSYFRSPIQTWKDKDNKGCIVDKSMQPKIEYLQHNKKVKVTVPPTGKFTLSPDIGIILGFAKGQLNMKNRSLEDELYVKGHAIADIASGLQAIYIYSDLIEPVPVGDTMAPLLRIVDTDSDHGRNCIKQYEKPRYLPVRKKNFDTIEIDIRTDTGMRVPFENGKVIVVLHFRQSKFAYFTG